MNRRVGSVTCRPVPPVSGHSWNALRMLPVSPPLGRRMHSGIRPCSSPGDHTPARRPQSNRSLSELLVSSSLTQRLTAVSTSPGYWRVSATLANHRTFSDFPLNRGKDMISADRGPSSHMAFFIHYCEALRVSPLGVSLVLSVKQGLKWYWYQGDLFYMLFKNL